eukprot:scaffold21923_cov66-Phaeocystis_antarctica.AAC.1
MLRFPSSFASSTGSDSTPIALVYERTASAYCFALKYFVPSSLCSAALLMIPVRRADVDGRGATRVRGWVLGGLTNDGKHNGGVRQTDRQTDFELELCKMSTTVFAMLARPR